MIPVKAYAALTPTSALVPFDFERRDLREHDILLDIQYSGVCHSDLHQARDGKNARALAAEALLHFVGQGFHTH